MKFAKAIEVPERQPASNYPEPFLSRVRGIAKRQLGDLFGLSGFGVNLTEIAPHKDSSVFHTHSKQEEFIYILQGRPTLVLEQGEFQLEPGMCAGFIPGGSAHNLVNRTDEKVLYLEVGSRIPDDVAIYTRDDMKQEVRPGGKKVYLHKDGSPY